MASKIDLNDALQEFSRLKVKNQTRNYEYYLLRQAVKGNFRWPTNWPTHVQKVTRNMCKPVTQRFAAYLMGKGFSWNINRPNTLEFRDRAERSEKILKRLMDKAGYEQKFLLGAKTGSRLGRTVFKVYKAGSGSGEHACFQHCQPDYFYGVRSSDESVNDYAVVYYSYPIDITEARKQYGNLSFRAEADLENDQRYDVLPENQANDAFIKSRKVPVLEIWRKDAYALLVGGQVIYNGKNPYAWSDSGEGFIPFVVIENMTSEGTNEGVSDIAEARIINEYLNYLVSRKDHIVSRWLQPTLVWEGAPQNFAEVLASTVGGGGAIPARLGSRLYFLAYDRPNATVSELEVSYRDAILEVSGMTEAAYQGNLSGSINTGPSSQAQYAPTMAIVQEKQREWSTGLKTLCAMLLQVQEDIGDSTVLGETVVNQTDKSIAPTDGELVTLSGKDIQGLRNVEINWPGILPKDDITAARFEVEKSQQGMQSIYTTLEKLGEEYPDDEIARIRMENQDPALRGQVVAEQTRSDAAALKAQTSAEQSQFDQVQQSLQSMQQGMPAQAPEEMDPAAMAQEPQDLGARLRELRRNKARLVESGDGFPSIATGEEEQGL